MDLADMNLFYFKNSKMFSAAEKSRGWLPWGHVLRSGGFGFIINGKKESEKVILKTGVCPGEQRAPLVHTCPLYRPCREDRPFGRARGAGDRRGFGLLFWGGWGKSMRLRRKPWARPELAACPFFVDEPAGLLGRWHAEFGNGAPLYLELGCGKGGFLAEAAVRFPEVNFLGVDIKSEVLVLAKRKVEQSLAKAGRGAERVRLTAVNIERIGEVLGEQDRCGRIYINFCNPWPKKKSQKHRLTHPRQLESYKAFLPAGGEIHFKTDHDALFEDTLCYFAECGYEVTELCRSLPEGEGIETEHERMFRNDGILIKYAVAKRIR